MGDARVADDDRQALGARDGNVHSVAVEDEGKSAQSVFAVAGAEGKDADRSFLSLEAIHAANPCSVRQGSLQSADLGIVGSNEEEVIQSQRPDTAVFGGV